MACRDTKKMELSINELKEQNSNLKLTGMALDLGDSKSIDAFVEEGYVVGADLAGAPVCK